MRPDPEYAAPSDGGRASERLRTLASLLGMESSFLEQCVVCGAVRLGEVSGDRVEFTPSDLARLRRLQRICRGLEIDVFAACIIVDLLDRVDGLRQEMERLRECAEERPAGL